MTIRFIAVAACTMLAAANAVAQPNAKQQVLGSQYEAAAKAADQAFKAASAERGRAFFMGKHTGGKADSPSCTSCHTADLTKTGKTRAGKDIEPMAASVSPARYTDATQVEKWFKRNCADVLGRECTAGEKADILAFLLSL